MVLERPTFVDRGYRFRFPVVNITAAEPIKRLECVSVPPQISKNEQKPILRVCSKKLIDPKYVSYRTPEV